MGKQRAKRGIEAPEPELLAEAFEQLVFFESPKGWDTINPKRVLDSWFSGPPGAQTGFWVS